MKRINIKLIVVMGVLAALSVVLVMLVHFPLIPTATFLEYDPADIPIYISTFIYGPVVGIVITVLVSLIQGLTVSAATGGMFYGILMHIVSTGTFVLVSGLIYCFSKKNNTFVIVSLVAGVIATTLIMIPANLIITPVFMGLPVSAVQGLLIPAIIPFNLLKQCINAAVTALIYAPIAKTVNKFI